MVHIETETRFDQVVYSSTGEVQLFINEEEVKIPVYPMEEGGEITYVDGYGYDTYTLKSELPINSEAKVLDAARDYKDEEINAYDVSSYVNSFTLNGKSMWLPKSDRVGLVNSITTEKNNGKTTTTLWFDGVKYEFGVDDALGMLGALELYALDCYNVTHSHISEVDALTDVESILNYDVTAGYPDKLVFNA